MARSSKRTWTIPTARYGGHEIADTCKKIGVPVD
jgi:hypothetical protein